MGESIMKKLISLSAVLMMTATLNASTTTDNLENEAAILTPHQAIEGTGCPFVDTKEILTLDAQGRMESQGQIWIVAPDSTKTIKTLATLEGDKSLMRYDVLQHGKMASMETQGKDKRCTYTLYLHPDHPSFSDFDLSFTLIHTEK